MEEKMLKAAEEMLQELNVMFPKSRRLYAKMVAGDYKESDYREYKIALAEVCQAEKDLDRVARAMGYIIGCSWENECYVMKKY